MAESPFAPHGQYRLFWCGDVMYSEMVGTFNEVAIRRYLEEMKGLAAHRSTRWGRIADMRQWDGGTPAAAALFKEFAEWVKTTQCKVSVQLLPDSFRLAIAASTAKQLNTHHLYQVTTTQEALDVLGRYAIATPTLAAVLAGAPLPCPD